MGIPLSLQASGAKREHSATISNGVTSDNAQGEEVGCSFENGPCKDPGKKWNIPRHHLALVEKEWDKRVRALTERR